MKQIFLTLFSLILIAGMLGAAEPSTAPAEPSEGTKQLLLNAQKLVRNRRLDVTVISNAYAEVFATADLPVAERAGGLVDLSKAYFDRKQADVGHALLDQAVAITAAPASVRIKALNAKADALFKANFKGAFASYFTKGIDAAAEIYQQILDMPDASNAEKIDAYQSLANCLLEKMEVEEANMVLAAALKLPGLSQTERETAINNQADAFYRQMAYAKALKLYESLWRADLHIHQRRRVENRILEITKRLEGAEAAIDLMKNRFPEDLMRLAKAYRDNDQTSEAIATYDALIAQEQEKANPNPRVQATPMRSIVLLFSDATDFSRFQQEIETRLDKIPSVKLSILNYMKGHPFNKSAVSKMPAFVKWHAEKMAATLAAQSDQKPMVPDGEEMNAFIKAGNRDQALAECKKLLADKNTPPQVLLNAALTRVILDAKDNAEASVKLIDKTLDADAVMKTGKVARAKALLTCSQTAMRMRFYETAKALYAAREEMLVPNTRPSLACPFIPNGPKTVSEFKTSAYFKNPKNRARLDRKYGNNLQFLLDTDAAMTGREVTDGKDGAKPTEFVATCDDEGVYIFFFAPSSKARAVEAGFERLGGYEMYLAGGPNDPYDCFLVGFPPNGRTTIFNTQYDNMGYRQLSADKRNVEITHRFYDDGVATLMKISWTAYFNRLPSNGSIWDFEVCHWDQGGRSWGGSKSVHNRSSFGALVFENLTPENKLSIQRRLLPAAARVYRNALSSKNGYVEIWQDPELGDQKFFFDVVEPLQTRLSSDLPKVKYEMTDAEVAEVFENSAIEWMNIDYIISALRRDYLDARRVSGE